MDDDRDLRRDLAHLVRRLLEEPSGGPAPVAAAIVEHLGPDAGSLPVLTEQLRPWELANLQLALDALLARPGCSARLLGIAGTGKRFSMLGLGDLIQAEGGGPWGTVSIGAPEYTTAPCGPGRTMPCLELGLLLVTAPEGPACLLVRRGDDHGPMPGLAVQAVASAAGHPESILADLRVLMAEHDVYRGQMIAVEADAHGGSTVAFVERPTMGRSESSCPPAPWSGSSVTWSRRPATARR